MNIKVNYKKKYLSFPVKKNFEYDISFWQLKEGKESWLRALSYKNWFSASLADEFSKVFDKLKKEKYF